MHQDVRHAALPRDPRERPITGHAGDIIEQVGARIQGSGSDRDRAGIHAQWHVRQRVPNGPEDGYDTRQLLVHGHWHMPRSSRFTADVQDVGALGDHPDRAVDGHIAT